MAGRRVVSGAVDRKPGGCARTFGALRAIDGVVPETQRAIRSR